MGLNIGLGRGPADTPGALKGPAIPLPLAAIYVGGLAGCSVGGRTKGAGFGNGTASSFFSS